MCERRHERELKRQKSWFRRTEARYRLRQAMRKRLILEIDSKQKASQKLTQFDELTKSWLSKEISAMFGKKSKMAIFNTTLYPSLLRDFNLWSNPTRLNDGRLSLTVDSIKSTSLACLHFNLHILSQQLQP